MKQVDIRVGTRTLGETHPPFIIAEMSGNHNQSLDRALQIVDEAAKAGCHALKIQTYTADTMTLDVQDSRFVVDLPLWKGRTLYELYQEAYTPWEWHSAIFERARSHGMIPFSTPFDATAVDFLESLGVELYKVASFENTDIPLLRKIASTGKPIIMSTGMASLAEIEESVQAIRGCGNSQIVLLKCTSSYPASPENSNIVTIPHLRDMHNVLVGISDHTLGIGVSVAAVALGARVIEKHFCLSRSEGGVDSAFSLEPLEMKSLVEESERAFLALGKICYECTDSEVKSRRFRRSIFVVKDIEAGEPFTQANVRIVRPSDGLAPKHFDDIVKRRSRVAIKRGTPLAWEMVD
jgi:N-acetylneuraminate synthase